MTNLPEHRICPICGEDNGCRIGNKDCWCSDFDFPQGLLDMVPEDKRRKVCICKKCAVKYMEENNPR